MDKHSYETYEFLTTANTNTDTNQFFVLQDDGTILTVNKEIQYVSQDQTSKSLENINQAEGCATVFDVSSQQYYVDVDNSTPELISISDEFAIPNGENNVYTGSYLIQPEHSITPQQMETESVVDPLTFDAQQLQQSNVEALNGTKQANDLTEITLSDEQYQILEQKGWILLESNDRIFVLNTLGLHDITDNDKLIQKLKNELQDEEADKKPEEVNIIAVFPNEIDESCAVQNDSTMEFVLPNNPPEDNEERAENIRYIMNNTADVDMNDQNVTNETKLDFHDVPIQISKLINNENSEAKVDSQQPKCDSIKIKTKYTFADIPDKIFLGKTVNGKKLFAKVTKLMKNNIIKAVNSNNYKKKKSAPPDLYGKVIEKKPFYNTGLESSRFINLIQDSFRSGAKVSPQVIASATSVIAQLMRLPNMKDSIVGTNLVVTKIVTSKTENGKEIGQPTLVTGSVNMQNDEGCFVHIPGMLQLLLDKLDADPLSELSEQKVTEQKAAKDLIDLFHIHISETRFADKICPQTSINLSKRKLALDVLKDAKKKHPNPVYACGSCGDLFKSESLLKDHQNTQCLEVDDELTIDTDEMNKDRETFYSVVDNGKEKSYTCLICEAKFARLFNCQKHIKTHKTDSETKLKVFRCKMCPSTYFHSSSLSKHIVKMHITQIHKN